MKKIIIRLVTFIVCMLIAFGLMACTLEADSKEKESYFAVVYYDSSLQAKIVYDRDTKVMYAVSRGSNNGGNLTMLVNEDGTPKLYEGE